jgi:maltooligosyltrehalose trehalohydrolase
LENSTLKDVVASGKRRRSVGAEYTGGGHASFRVWAPKASRVDVVFEADGRWRALEPEPHGYFAGIVPADPGEDYRLCLNGNGRVFPDPASRYQPQGPHGPSRLIDAASFPWNDERWGGVRLEGQVIYEMHVGTFTREGTWRRAAEELEWLGDLGITVIEMMPVADFEGRFGWGYDGVNMFAPYHAYGEPDDLRRFVDRAHAAGVAVILDVVYNHLGPSGNYLREFSDAYFTSRYENEWGDAINFDGPDAQPVREFFLDNASYWIEEFHMDGLRLDATQQVFDESQDHILAEIGKRVRRAAGMRSTIVVAENEPQETRLVRALTANGYGLDGLWNDDFHHSAMVALTGRAEAYYSDTRGDAQELLSAAKYGYLFQGQYYSWQEQPRGMPGLDLPPARFITFLQNHDQIANSATGQRGPAVTTPGKWRTITALWLLMPGTPMLFQGQEFSASAPFLYFADFDGDLAAAVRAGRAEFLTQFPGILPIVESGALDDPGDPRTCDRCKLDLHERERHSAATALHRDLLRMRREQEAFHRQAPGGIDGAVLSDRAFIMRFFAERPDDERLLVVNLGGRLLRSSIADPLAAPPVARGWRVEWCSDDAEYGGPGRADLWQDGEWSVAAECAYVLAPGPADTRPRWPARKRRTA